MNIGQRIRKRREELELSVMDVATALHVHRSTIYRYESNDIEKFPTDALEPLARVLHTTPSYLMGWSDNPSEEEAGWYTPLKYWEQINQDREGFLHYYFETPGGLSPQDLKNRWNIDGDAPNSASDNSFKAFLKESVESVRLYADNGEWLIRLKPDYSSASKERPAKADSDKNGEIAPFLSDEAMQIAIDYSLLDPYGKRAVRVILKDQQKRMMEEEAAAPHRDNVIPLPKSIQKTSAGRGAYLGPEEMETIMVEENDLTRRASFCVPVSGDSMEPTYHDGDILLVEGREDIEPGQIGVFTVDGDGYVKKRGAGELISLNPDYAPIPLTENSWCNGLVIGVLDKAWIRE